MISVIEKYEVFFLTIKPGDGIYRRMSMDQSTDLAAYAEAFKALSNPNRLAIFLHLIACCPPGTSCSFEEEMKKCVGELARGLSIGQPTISHHIKELRKAGLIHVVGPRIEWTERESVFQNRPDNGRVFSA